MIYQHQPSTTARRQGVILLVVISLLTLFAIVGISFVLYANAAANASKIFRDAAAQNQPDMDPELLLNYFLNQLIYDADDVNGIYSGMRGHSLSRSMYGLNYNLSPTGGMILEAFSGPMNTPAGPLNAIPFTGTGRLHTGLSPMNNYGDDYPLINYTYYPTDQFIRYPERLTNGIVTTGGVSNPPFPPATFNFTGGANAPYTYPDLNNMFLAAVKADGTVLMPSFHRHWLFNDPGKTFDDTTNSNWISPQGKYLLLRPRPKENPGFPYPEDPGGDVKNFPGPGYLNPLTGQYANNDSVWIDLNAPVMIAPDGTKFKALFAPLIIDLDGRVNLNVAGNIRGYEGQPRPIPPGTAPFGIHRSNQGWGPWEMNLEYILPLPSPSGTTAEWPNLLLGNGIVTGRYGPDQQPYTSGAVALAGSAPHFYGQVDFDGSDETKNYGNTNAFQFSNTPGNAFPQFPTGYGNGSPVERTDHPLNYNYFQPGGDDRVFPLSNMEALLRYGDTNSPALTSDLFRLCPSNFQNSRIRNLLTTISFDLDQAGLAPWLNTYTLGVGPYQANANPSQAPYGPPIPFPQLGQRQPGQSNNGEFGGNDWRGFNAALGTLNGVLAKVNLNRYLTPYPSYTDGTHPQLVNYAGRYDDSSAPQSNQILLQFKKAQDDRVQLVSDIYNVLQQVTGVPVPAPNAITGPQDPQLVPLRWLAQLAVNIVDYIDEDDISTPFNFFQGVPPSTNAQLPGYWVFGTELPHVVLNEVLAEYQTNTTPPPKAGDKFNMNFWIELYNAFQNVPAAINQQTDGQAVQLNIPAPGGPSASNATNANGSYPPYQVVIATGIPANQFLPSSYTSNDNVLGEIDMTTASYRTQTAIATDQNANSDFGGANTTLVSGGAPISPTIPQGGFFLLVPKPGPSNQSDPIGGPIANTAQPNTAWLKSTQMQYQCTITAVNTKATPPTITSWTTQAPTGVGPQPAGPGTDNPNTKYVVLLRRLANPHIPYQPNPAAGIWYNPYITVDYQDSNLATDMKNPPTGKAQSTGKVQPYAASQVVLQGNAPAAGQTSHTFGQINNNGPNPAPAYDWLVHLDRQLISPMELLQVSGYQPWQLTHQFINPAGTLPSSPKFQHRVPWFDEDQATAMTPQSHRLYRLFEFLETGNRAAGMTPGGRIPGKVNINTIWDPEIPLALADYQPGNSNAFDRNAINNAGPPPTGMWPTLLSLRSTQIAPGVYAPGQNDRPFWSLAAGFYPTSDTQFQGGVDAMNNPVPFGINNTLLRSATAGGKSNSARLFQGTVGGTPPSHPYLQDELLTKLFNNLTTRSNVFAVFLTVGFFQVTDDTARPVRLGAEIGRAENRHIRHRMFAIVDRTNLATDKYNPNTIQPPPVYLNGSLPVSPPPPAPPIPPYTIAIPDGQLTAGGAGQLMLTGTYEGIRWFIQAPSQGAFPTVGSNVLIDTGPNQELVNVGVVNPPTPTLPPTIQTTPWTKAHAGPIAVTPVNTVTAYTQIQAGSGTTNTPPVQIAVSAVNGQFQGVNWNFQVGTIILLDAGSSVGGSPEAALIVNPPPVPPAQGQPGSINIQSLNAGGFQFHRPGPSGGYTISYPIPVGGNPGPQTNFDMRQVPWVVRHISIIN